MLLFHFINENVTVLIRQNARFGHIIGSLGFYHTAFLLHCDQATGQQQSAEDTEAEDALQPGARTAVR